MMPPIMVQYMIMEKYFCASLGSPSPSVFDTIAFPPIPSINPIAPRIIMNGMIRLTDAKAVFPTKLDTNSPSTTL